MVTAENGDSVREAHLESNKKCDSLNTIVTTVDVIAHEKVVGVGRLSTNLEELAKIVELTVDVTANSHRCAYLLHVRLVDQNFLGLHGCDKN